MKIMHLSDLHLGKSIYGLSLIDEGDQPVLIRNILDAVKTHQPDAVIIAGDVYDRSNPSEGAVKLFEDLLNGLMDLGAPAMIISGNHDSVKRLSYLNATLKNHNVHIADELSPELESVTLKDERGEVVFWLMPYVYPALISHVLGDDDIKYKDYDTAVRELLSKQNIDPSERNVLIAHQNVVQNGKAAEPGGSESTVGGVGAIESSAFDIFDYVALGHIHAGYDASGGRIKYCGTPMCYHFDETRQKEKGGLLVEIKDKGSLPEVSKIAFVPEHPLTVIEGAYDEIKQKIANELKGKEYVKVILTDRGKDYNIYADLYNLINGKGAKLLELQSAYKTPARNADMPSETVRGLPIEEAFGEFYHNRRGEDLDDKDARLAAYLAAILSEEDFEDDNISAAASEKAAERLLDFLSEN